MVQGGNSTRVSLQIGGIGYYSDETTDTVMKIGIHKSQTRIYKTDGNGNSHVHYQNEITMQWLQTRLEDHNLRDFVEFNRLWRWPASEQKRGTSASVC
jgi:hypothetical protein